MLTSNTQFDELIFERGEALALYDVATGLRGGFAAALYDAFLVADQDNKTRLRCEFPELLGDRAAHAKRLDVLSRLLQVESVAHAIKNHLTQMDNDGRIGSPLRDEVGTMINMLGQALGSFKPLDATISVDNVMG
jgi:hypothetical protein